MRAENRIGTEAASNIMNSAIRLGQKIQLAKH
jgi:hypothetical protein